MRQTNGSATVLSIATNGVAETYRTILNTHRAYAARHGYRHLLVDHPGVTLTSRESMWLKIPLMQRLVESGPALYVDADAEITVAAPPIESVLVPRKQVYMARGASGRYNAGVILAVDCPEFFKTLLDNYYAYIPVRDRVRYLIDDNAHLIYFSRNNPIVETLDVRWNNCTDETLDDYIRHYTGPLSKYRPGWQPARRPAAERLARVRHRLLARASSGVVADIVDTIGPWMPRGGRFPTYISGIAARILADREM